MGCRSKPQSRSFQIWTWRNNFTLESRPMITWLVNGLIISCTIFWIKTKIVKTTVGYGLIPIGFKSNVHISIPPLYSAIWWSCIRFFCFVRLVNQRKYGVDMWRTFYPHFTWIIITTAVVKHIVGYASTVLPASPVWWYFTSFVKMNLLRELGDIENY